MGEPVGLRFRGAPSKHLKKPIPAMIKDFISIAAAESHIGEIGFVEAYWSRQLLGQLGAELPKDLLRRREEYRFIKPYLARLPAGARVLDGGCGAGEWTIALSREGFETTGLDISQALISRLQERFPKQRFVRGDLRDLPFEADSFDALFSWGAFEHFEIGLAPCLAEACRVLKPGGWLFVTVPFANRRIVHRHERGLVKDFLPRVKGPPAAPRLRFYQWRLTRGELARELACAGFEPTATRLLHKEEGLRRLLRHDIGLSLTPGSFPEHLLLTALRFVMPAGYAAHILIAAGRKRCDPEVLPERQPAPAGARDGLSTSSA